MAEAPAAPKGLKVAGIAAVIVAAGVVVIGTMSRANDTHEAQSWSNARSVPTVHLVDAKDSAATDGLTLPGTMAAWNAAKLYARVGGYVQGWSKDIGAEVGGGTPLGTIETPELDQQIIQARAALAKAKADASLAKSTATRWNDLLTDHSVSEQEADEKNGDFAAKNAAVQGAEADLGRLMALKSYATVRAPFAGVVTARNVDIGDLVGPGASTQQPMFSIADVRRIRLYVSVPQAYAAAMASGLDATLSVPDQPGRSFDAKVIGTSGSINPQTGTLEVQLVADNPGRVLKPGGYAQVKFSVPGQAGTVTIPSSSLVFRAAGTQVAMVDPNDHIHMQPVTLGRDLGGTVEVVTGLGRNAKIVDNPPDSIAQGELVRVGNDHG
ncbi:efflux RND transporter periplasmic adaptor subunit [Sphingomonas sp. CGMCC 1.13654]|uniref:Efflux RND transporter periplasmic adaptor subunit n=2 Tax=Sphingomonas chungangi TaxID=2683589 RepID=A0A838LGH3_9SPHN|nr:efflux RND transporter periplasmic adaptor subunit [Sphingomonas chungangi]MVW55913.1 efflux RND transporter periplasmic adaptor subunit [Sphingomonas chungangi]